MSNNNGKIFYSVYVVLKSTPGDDETVDGTSTLATFDTKQEAVRCAKNMLQVIRQSGMHSMSFDIGKGEPIGICIDDWIKQDEDSEVEESKIHAELKEYKEAVHFLKDKLHEVNILNAKLLFTNKLFKSYSLDNNQKLKVVETFDRAQTTREIKLVYSTLAEQFNDNGSIVTRKSIKESASAPVSSTKPSTESRKVISEETQVANRFKKLAGLIK